MWSGKQTPTRSARAERDGRERRPQFALRMDTFDGNDIDKLLQTCQRAADHQVQDQFDQAFEPFKQASPGQGEPGPARSC